MKQFILLTLGSFFALHLFGQARPGQKAPDIQVAEWVANTPVAPDLNQKFIVLEFWATWCAPCLKAVPHMNTLQEKFANRQDLLFVSISDEAPEKIRRTLQKVDMRALVAADDAQKTFRSFGVQSIPATVLIDPKRTVRWVGHPTDLDEKILQRFLNGQLKGKSKTSAAPTETVKAGEVPKPAALYRFEVTEGDPALKKGKTSGSSAGPNGVEVNFQNFTLAEILAALMDFPDNQIRLPEDFAAKVLTVQYTDPTFQVFYEKPEEAIEVRQAAMEHLVRLLLHAFALEQKEVFEEEPVYVLRVRDASKLSASSDVVSHMSMDNDLLAVGNMPLKSVAMGISRLMDIKLYDETGLMQAYDLTIRAGSMEQLQKSLAEYGLEMTQAPRPVRYLVFEPRKR